MSVQFDPSNQTPKAKPPEVPRKKGFLEKWADMMYKGAKMEATPCTDWCKEKTRKITSPDQAYLAYMRCMAKCAEFKRLCAWHRTT